MTKKRIILCLALAGLTLLAVVTASLALPAKASEARSPSRRPDAPKAVLGTEFTYQGQLDLDNQPVDNTCDFQFSLYDDESGSVQIGTTQTITDVAVQGGLFTAQLDFGTSAFQGDARWLGIKVRCEGDTNYADLGLQALTATPYALYALGAPWSGISDLPADFADGIDDVNEGDITGVYAGEGLSGGGASGPVTLTVNLAGSGSANTAARSDHTHPEYDTANLVLVAQSGGDYASVQAAIDSIDDAAADNPYLVWVAPGVYSETVTLKPHVHLQGAGQETTLITSTVSNSGWPFIQGTLNLTHHVSLRDLTVGNAGPGPYNVALLALDGVTQTRVSDVMIRTQGSGADSSYAICLAGSGTGVTLLDVTALAQNSTQNYGLYNTEGAAAIVRGGSLTTRGGSEARAIYNYGNDTRLEAEDVIILAEDSAMSYGLFNYYAKVTLRGGSFMARASSSATGLSSNGSGAELDVESVAVLSKGSGTNYGLFNGLGTVTTVRGGSFTARGGTSAWGMYNNGTGARLSATSVTALGEDADENYGLSNSYYATATLHGGSFTALGGTNARGIHNFNISATLEAENVTALAQDGNANYGLHNDNGAMATLQGGSFVARGGNYTRGIYTQSDNTKLKAQNISLLGEEGSTINRGLESSAGADVIITQSVLKGADNSIITTGGGGPVAVSNSRLIDGSALGNVSCTAVSRGSTFNANGCP